MSRSGRSTGVIFWDLLWCYIDFYLLLTLTEWLRLTSLPVCILLHKACWLVLQANWGIKWTSLVSGRMSWTIQTAWERTQEGTVYLTHLKTFNGMNVMEPANIHIHRMRISCAKSVGCGFVERAKLPAVIATAIQLSYLKLNSCKQTSSEHFKQFNYVCFQKSTENATDLHQSMYCTVIQTYFCCNIHNGRGAPKQMDSFLVVPPCIVGMHCSVF